MSTLHMSSRVLQRYKQVQALLNQLEPQAESKALVVPGSPLPRGNVIVFPGSFNPPTTAHLALLKQAQQYAHMTFTPGEKHKQAHETWKVYAAFSKRTVDKENVERPLLSDRIVLLEHILKARTAGTGIMLFNRGLYVEEAQAVRSSFPRVRHLFFLLGFDKIVQILDPHYYADRDTSLHELFALAKLFVAPRGNDGEKELDVLIHKPENEPFAQYIHALPFNPIYRKVSSTHVREGLRDAVPEIPREVRKFMRDTRAYAPPLRRRDGTEIDFYEERVKALEALLR